MTPPEMLEGAVNQAVVYASVSGFGHTREVLDELGLPGAEIERLAASGAIQVGSAG